MKWSGFAVLAAFVSAALAGGGINNTPLPDFNGPINGYDFGLPAVTDASCDFSGTTGGSFTGAGWYIDRMFDSICFPRMVYCDGANNVREGVWRTCEDVNEMFVSDGDLTCYSGSSSTALSACGVTVNCNADSIDILVTASAVLQQTASDLQFGNSGNCRDSYTTSRYEYTVDLTTNEWSTCGITRSVVTDEATGHTDNPMGGGDGTSIMYTIDLRRYDSRSNRYEETNNGVTVTRERCFMATAYCYYNADGTASSAYKPSSPNILEEHDTDDLEFELVPANCGDFSDIATQGVYVDTDVCFKARITTDWHTDIRVQIDSCWTTDMSGNNAYSLATRDATDTSETDSTFNWMCYPSQNPYADLFQFTAFRYQESTLNGGNNNDPTYVQSIMVVCDVLACEIDDTSSVDCDDTCGVPSLLGRRRRDVSPISKYTRSQVQGRMYVYPKQEQIREIVKPSYSFYSDSLAMGMFTVGCVLGVVVIGLMVVLKYTKDQRKMYGQMFA